VLGENLGHTSARFGDAESITETGTETVEECFDLEAVIT
jgi:hypothetical protein